MPRIEHANHPLERLVLDDGALDFLGQLETQFGPRRRALLAARALRQQSLDRGELPEFSNSAARGGEWQVAEAPKPLLDRRVEITGPTDRKMMINALNSGAQVFMAELKDATSPTWSNIIAGQVNLQDAVLGTLRLTTPERTYQLAEETATLVVRPRGWHLEERHLTVDGAPISASLFDFGCFVRHNALPALERGFGPYLYLPKLEGHLEARLWRDVFIFAEDALGLARGTIRATVLIETVLAAFEMEEILFELRQHVCGLNAGRWDYIFSMVKKFARHREFLLPDRATVTMSAPFMHAYTELLVATCHRRGAHAIGGMSAFIPNRRDNEPLERVAEDKAREASEGFDGTWVAHPALVPVARAEFDAVLGDEPNQLDRRPSSDVGREQLLAVSCPPGGVTMEGLRRNVSVALRYLVSWFSGVGAAAIDDLMEDVADREIRRAQLWQWAHHGAELGGGELVTRDLVVRLIEEEYARLADDLPRGLLAQARELLTELVVDDGFAPFLTVPAYAHLA